MDKKQYLKDYKKANIIRVQVDLNKITDTDIIQYLNSIDNKAGFIKKAIRHEIMRMRFTVTQQRADSPYKYIAFDEAKEVE